MTTPDLFTAWDIEPPSVAGSDTSVAAAKQIEPVSGALRRAVLAFIRDHGPVTDEEIQLSLGMGANTERPRRRELQQMGMIQDSGKTKPTLSGRKAVAWVLAQGGSGNGQA